MLAAGVVPVNFIAFDYRLLGRADNHTPVEGVAGAARERNSAGAIGMLPADAVAAVDELAVDGAVAGDLVPFARDLLGGHVENAQQPDMKAPVTKGGHVVKFGAQRAVPAPGNLVIPVARLQDRVGVLPGAGQRGAFRVADDPPLVAVVKPLERIGAVNGIDRIPNHVERALVAAFHHRLKTIMGAPLLRKGYGNVVIPVNAVGGGEQEDAAVAAAEADRLIALVLVLLVAVDEDGGPVEVPDDVVGRAAVECEYAKLRLSPVDAVIALRVQGEVAPVVVDEGASITVCRDAVAVERSFVGAGDIEAGDLVVAVRHAPVGAHAAEVPHPVLANQIVVKGRAVEMDALAHPGAAGFPGFVGVRLHDEWRLDAGLDCAGDPVFLLNEGFVEEEDALSAAEWMGVIFYLHWSFTGWLARIDSIAASAISWA